MGTALAALGGATGLLSAGVSAGSNIATNVTNAMIAKRNNSSLERIAAENNATQMQIADKNNDLQERMNNQNNQFSHDEAELAYQRDIDKMLMENQYNSPIEQLKRFAEAGINPTLGLLGNAAMPAVNVSGSAQASPHGSGITSSMPSFAMPSFQNPVMQPFDLASTLKSLAEARKTGVEGSAMFDAYDSMVNQIKQNARIAENQADMVEFDNYLKSRYGEARFNAETRKLLEDTYLSTSLALKAEREGDLAIAQKQREIAHKNVLELDKELKIKERDHWEEMFELKANQIKADTAKSTAEANKAQEEAFTESQLRQYRQDLLVSDKNAADESAHKLSAEVSHYALINNLIPQGTDITAYRKAVLKQIQEDVKSKEFDNTWTGRLLRGLAGPASNVGAAALITLPKL